MLIELYKVGASRNQRQKIAIIFRLKRGNAQTKIFNDSLNTYKSKKKLLDKQLIIVSDSNYNPGKVFELNKKFKLEDSNFEKK